MLKVSESRYGCCCLRLNSWWLDDRGCTGAGDFRSEAGDKCWEGGERFRQIVEGQGARNTVSAAVNCTIGTVAGCYGTGLARGHLQFGYSQCEH